MQGISTGALEPALYSQPMFTRNTIQAVFAFAVACLGFGFSQAPAPPVLRLAAETANLNGGPTAVRIDVLAWSTDAARSQLVDAWNLIPPAPGAGGRGAGAAGGRGARGTRGGGAAAPQADGTPTTPAPQATTRGTRGTRGGPTAGIAPTAVPDTPEKALAAALESSNGVGYLWTSESTGYSLRYAYRLPQPDGGERIILATDRRLGDRDGSWKPAGGPVSDYGFSIIELRLNSKREGEGKASVTGKVGVDSSANTIALDSYATLPITLKNVKTN